MDDPPKSTAKFPPARVVTYAALAIGGAAADLWSKHAVFSWRGLPGESDVYWIVDGYFGIQTAVNPGAVFGAGAGFGMVFAAVSVLAAIGVFVWLFVFGAISSRWLTVALGMVTGGIVGNLYDRLGLWWQPGYPEVWRSGVRDWILWQASDAYRWPNFNIADSLLVTGAVMLVLHSFFVPANDSGSADDSDTDSANNSGSPSPRFGERGLGDHNSGSPSPRFGERGLGGEGSSP